MSAFTPLLRRASFAGACALALVAGTADAAVTKVYKCFDRNLNVVYTDQPCRGEQLSIEGGSIDPVAVAELQREREAVTRSAAQRVNDLRTRPEPVPQYVYNPPAPAASDYIADGYYPYGYGYGYTPYYSNDRPLNRPNVNRNQHRERYLPAPKGDLIKR